MVVNLPHKHYGNEKNGENKAANEHDKPEGEVPEKRWMKVANLLRPRWYSWKGQYAREDRHND